MNQGNLQNNNTQFDDKPNHMLPRMWRRYRRKANFPNESFRVGLERPSQQRTVSSKIEIRGWAVSLSGKPIVGEILIGNKVIENIMFTKYRQDVASMFDLDKKESKVGFQHFLNYEQLVSDADNNTSIPLLIQFRSDDKCISLGPYTFEKPVNKLVDRSQGSFRVGLERPCVREESANVIEMRGWAVAFDGAPIEGKVFVSGNEVATLPLDIIREDVAITFGLEEDQKKVGFNSKIKWSELGNDITEAELHFEFVHNREKIFLGPIKVTRTKSPILSHERGSYKDVWNEASETSQDAMSAVAATTNVSELFSSGRLTAATIKEAIEINESDDVLEIGCGVGRVGVALAPCCKSWTGSDISGRMLEYARKNLSEYSNIQLTELVSNDLSEFEDESFDKVYCTTVFMHLDEWDRYRYVKEAYRVLRLGGRCYFDNLNLCGEEGWGVFEELSQYDSAQRPANISKTSTKEELCHYLIKAGFSDVRSFPEKRYVSVTGVKTLCSLFRSV
jgi:ubiquinone/menaquinone biosynthesis C-methylase UbiE